MKKNVKKSKGLQLFFRTIPFVVFACLFIFISQKNTFLCANSISCIADLSGTYQEVKQGEFHGKKISAPDYVPDKQRFLPVLGETTEPKKIKVDLSTQTLFAYEGKRLVFKFPVSTGKWAPTPTGTFSVWIKLRYMRMSGGNPAWGTYYNLPNVPFTMFYYNKEVPKNKGYSIHGAYWHDNFGHPMSHGCVNMKIENAEEIYYWARPYTGGLNPVYSTEDTPGTEIEIYGKTPQET